MRIIKGFGATFLFFVVCTFASVIIRLVVLYFNADVGTIFSFVVPYTAALIAGALSAEYGLQAVDHVFEDDHGTTIRWVFTAAYILMWGSLIFASINFSIPMTLAELPPAIQGGATLLALWYYR